MNSMFLIIMFSIFSTSAATAAPKSQALMRRMSEAQPTEDEGAQLAELDSKAEADCVPSGMRAVTTKAGFKMVVLGDDDIVSKSFAQTGFWEISDTSQMVPESMRKQITLPAKGTLLDIGANIGDYTMLFASKGYNVIAVEPMTRNRAAMHATICLNPQFKDRVTIVPAALVAPDEVAGKLCVIRSTNSNINIGNGFLQCGSEAEVKGCAAADKNCENVPVKTLDSALAELKVKAIDVVKMDVENYECHVLAGGQSLFTKYQPQMLQVETQWGNTSKCVAAMGSKYSYKNVKLTRDLNEDTLMVSERMLSSLSLVQQAEQTSKYGRQRMFMYAPQSAEKESM